MKFESSRIKGPRALEDEVLISLRHEAGRIYRWGSHRSYERINVISINSRGKVRSVRRLHAALLKLCHIENPDYRQT